MRNDDYMMLMNHIVTIDDVKSWNATHYMIAKCNHFSESPKNDETAATWRMLKLLALFGVPVWKMLC